MTAFTDAQNNSGAFAHDHGSDDAQRAQVAELARILTDALSPLLVSYPAGGMTTGQLFVQMVVALAGEPVHVEPARLRDSFENWVTSRGNCGTPEDDTMRFAQEEGQYFSSLIQLQWETWIAAHRFVTAIQLTLASVRSTDAANLRLACHEAAEKLREGNWTLLANRLVSNVEAVLVNGAIAPANAPSAAADGEVLAWICQNRVTDGKPHVITDPGEAARRMSLPQTFTVHPITASLLTASTPPQANVPVKASAVLSTDEIDKIWQTTEREWHAGACKGATNRHILFARAIEAATAAASATGSK